MPIPEQQAPSRGRGFTLAELLVVIGVVGLLVALLLPALIGARRSANEARCASNLRVLGQALTQYAQATEYFPGGYAMLPSQWAAVWPVRLRPYLGGNYREVFLCPERDPEEFAWPAQVDPVAGGAVDWLVGYGYTVGEPMVLWKSRFSYGYNALGSGGGTDKFNLGLGGDVSPTALMQGVGEVRWSRVRSASEMIAIADSEGDGDYDPLIFAFLESSAPPGAVHHGGANFLFCDGHVQWFEQKGIALPRRADGSVPFDDVRWQAVIAMWRNNHSAAPPPQGN